MHIFSRSLDLAEGEAGDPLDLGRRELCIEIERTNTLPVTICEMLRAARHGYIIVPDKGGISRRWYIDMLVLWCYEVCGGIKKKRELAMS